MGVMGDREKDKAMRETALVVGGKEIETRREFVFIFSCGDINA